jgi:6-phosphofructokinase 1
MPEKIVLVTAGGHISAFHAAMKGIYETLEQNAPGMFNLIGANGGLEGLIKGDFTPIEYDDIDEDRAGSMIGCDRKIADTSKIKDVIRNNNIYAVIMMGGDNHLGEAAKCYKNGLNFVGYPKTMDGDLNSLITLGWHTAVSVGAKRTREHHTDAMTNRRVFYVGLFGRNTDWTLAGVSLYGGADLGIPCEQEYDLGLILNRVAVAVKENRDKYGKGFAVVPYSEGTRIKGIPAPPKELCSYCKHGLPKLQPEWIGMQLVRLTKENTGISAAFQAHTYDMRDSPPTQTDKTLSRWAGEECAGMILQGDFGKSAVFLPNDSFYRVSRAPLEEVCVQRKLKPMGFFDYEKLQTTSRFVDTYGNLFAFDNEVGPIPKKDDLVYRNMRCNK